jgi:hypothetical protein
LVDFLPATKPVLSRAGFFERAPVFSQERAYQQSVVGDGRPGLALVASRRQYIRPGKRWAGVELQVGLS